MALDDHGRFASPATQVLAMTLANRVHSFGFDQRDFVHLPPLPERPMYANEAVTLVARLPPSYNKSGIQRTVEAYLHFFKFDFMVKAGRIALMPDLKFDADHLVEIGEDEWKPGLTWEKIDVSAFWQKNIAYSPYMATLYNCSAGYGRMPGIAVLAAAAMHKDWLYSMDGVTCPHVWLPGLLLKIKGIDHHKLPYTPALSFRKHENVINFTASPSHFVHPQFAVPRYCNP